jgi:hypothetical protein
VAIPRCNMQKRIKQLTRLSGIVAARPRNVGTVFITSTAAGWARVYALSTIQQCSALLDLDKYVTKRRVKSAPPDAFVRRLPVCKIRVSVL